jgi:hypothetical protein
MTTESAPTPPPLPPTPAPQSRTTIAPKESQLSPSQIVADNFSTRLREFFAIAGLVAMHIFGKLDPIVAATIIAGIVLPIEVTRQIAKGRAAMANVTGGVATALAIFTALNKLLTFGAIGATALALVANCSAPQRTWDQSAHIAINTSTHALRTADTVLAELYTREARRAETIEQLDAVDARWHPAVVAERTAIASLLAAEHAVDTAVASGRSADKCLVRTLLLRARTHTDDALRIARDLGATIDPATESAIHVIEGVLASLAPACSSDGPTSSLELHRQAVESLLAYGSAR